MDRPIIYPGQIPLDVDVLGTARDTMLAVGYALRACLGVGTFCDGLACTPTIPASMQVLIGQGSITTPSTIDASAYGTIPADNANQLMKMGINPAGTTAFTLTAPGVSGQSINYLVEASFVEADGSPIALPYYNSSNPSQPFTGPANSQALQNTVRTQRVGLQLKAGAPASAGTQQTPAVDAGWVGLYFITVNFAQTTVTATSIFTYPGAPFIGTKIPALAPLASPALTGTGTSTTPPVGDVSTRIATMAALGALRGVIGRSFQTFNTPGSFTFVVPAGVTALDVEVWGAGGASGGSVANNGGSGGGGGGYCRKSLTGLTPGSSLSVTVGAGGSPGGPGNGGSIGGPSAFAGILTANGGSGGPANSAAGALGGTASGGDTNITGQSGNGGSVFSSTTVMGGGGGSSPRGGQAVQFGITAALGAFNGGVGQFPGGGAAGGASANGSGATVNGAAGAGGLVEVRW